MSRFIENIFAVAALVATEAWFLHGYFAGKPDFEPGIAFLAALGILLAKDPIRARISTSPTVPISAPSIQAKDHDRRLFVEFLATLPTEPTIRLLRDQDFGDSVRTKSIDPLFDFARIFESVEKEFLDQELEEQKRRLWVAADQLTQEINGRTVPIRMEGFISVFSDQQRSSGQPRPLSVLEDAKVLNRLATEFVTQYEGFVRSCRSKLAQ